MVFCDRNGAKGVFSGLEGHSRRQIPVHPKQVRSPSQDCPTTEQAASVGSELTIAGGVQAESPTLTGRDERTMRGGCTPGRG